MNKFLLLAVTLAGGSAFLSAHAQTISRIAVGEARVAAKSEAKLSVEYAAQSGSAWCGLEVDWGNGNKRDIRVGDGDAARSPFALGNTYDNPGTYTIRVQGKFLSRGLKSAQPCQVSAQSITVTVFDAVAEQQQKEAAERLATREREAAEREKRAQDEAAKAKAELEAVKRAAAERELELKRKEIELKEAELKQREQELQRKAAEPKANPARTITEKATPSASPPALPVATPPASSAPVAPPAINPTPTVRYLGLRLLDLVQPDPKVSPLPTALAQGLKECRFTKDEDNNQTKSEKCVIRDLAPTYKQRPKEELKITAETPRCCLGAVTIRPNQLTHEETLSLFEGIPGVKKTPAACKNIEAEDGHQEFFTISKDGKNKFTIKEVTSGGSGGSQTTTTIYYGMPTVDCKAIASIEKLQSDRIREANQKRSNLQAMQSSAPTPPKVSTDKGVSQEGSQVKQKSKSESRPQSALLRFEERTEYVRGWKRFVEFLNIQSIEEEIIVEEITLNRGNCQTMTVPAYFGAYRLNYGDTLKVMLDQCNLLEAEVRTNKGVFRYRSRN